MLHSKRLCHSSPSSISPLRHLTFRQFNILPATTHSEKTPPLPPPSPPPRPPRNNWEIKKEKYCHFFYNYPLLLCFHFSRKYLLTGWNSNKKCNIVEGALNKLCFLYIFEGFPSLSHLTSIAWGTPLPSHYVSTKFDPKNIRFVGLGRSTN